MTTVTLTGDAVTGLVLSPAHARKLAALPQTVCLGRRRTSAQPRCLRLADYGTRELLAALPDKIDWYTKAAEPIGHMYLNDRYGDCVFAGKAHSLGGWSANDADSGPTIIATDKEIQDQYFAYTGGRDVGANVAEVLQGMVDQGFTAGGKKYYLEGFVSVDWRSKELVKTALALFGPCSIGFNLPGSWTNSAVWDVTSSGSVGGHDVSPFGYGANLIGTNADGVVVSSWGRLYLFTWAAFTSTRYVDEMYAALPRDIWTGADQTTPLGATLTKLRADLAILKTGGTPQLPDVPDKLADYYI